MTIQKRITKRPMRRKIVYKDTPPMVAFYGEDGEKFYPIDGRFNAETIRRLTLIGLARYLTGYKDTDAAYERLLREGLYALKYPVIGEVPSQALRIQALANMYKVTPAVIRNRLRRLSKDDKNRILNKEEVIKAAREIDEHRRIMLS